MSLSGGPSSLHLATMAAAGAAVVALTACQTDYVSRRILAPDRLQHKRHSEYRYRWSSALEKVKIQLQYYCAGSTQDGMVAENVEVLGTNLLDSEDELKELVEKLVNWNKKGNDNAEKGRSPVRVGKIGTDPKMKEYASTCNELYVWLYQGAGTIYQVPLQAFGRVLADAMDRKITNTTFSFVADASSGVASRLVVDLIEATKDSTVAVVPEPLWMVFFAVIAEQNLVDQAMLERILFGLCRLEATAAIAKASAASNTSSPSEITTVVMTLPGQSTASLLLPLLQKVFPDDRHLFAYTGCVKSVEYATQARSMEKRATIPTTLAEALQFSNPTISHSSPLQLSLAKSGNVMPKFCPALAQLPVEQADTVESWMTAVDAFLNLKEEEKQNGYLPYVMRLDYLLAKGKSLEKESDRYWSLISLLQYILGARSRGIPEEHVDAARSVLQDYDDGKYNPAATASSKPLPPLECKAIQNVVFQHKLILIESKTLKDTVQPKEHWTLKAAAKAGCSCCAPEEEDEDANDMGALAGKLNEFAKETRAAAGRNMNAGGYVDGKTNFAFDPSRFASM